MHRSRQRSALLAAWLRPIVAVAVVVLMVSVTSSCGSSHNDVHKVVNLTINTDLPAYQYATTKQVELQARVRAECAAKRATTVNVHVASSYLGGSADYRIPCSTP
jgi:hypothetical protein